MRGLAAVAALALTLPAAPAQAVKDPVALGKELYVERCVLCHGSRGHGWDWGQKVAKPPVPVPDLVETVPGLDDAYLTRIILDGGEAVGKTRFMPAFGFQMSEAEAAAIVRYLRSIAGGRRRR